MLRGLVVGSLAIVLVACQPQVPLPISPGQGLPTPVPTASPTARPSPSTSPVGPSAPAPTPSAVPSTVPQVCLTPPPDDCCDIVYGALHGTVVDEDGQPIDTAHVTLRSLGPYLLGGCSDTEAIPVTDGRFAFNSVPFDTPLVLTATVEGYAPFRAATRVDKGPVMDVVVRMKRGDVSQ